MSQQLTPEMQTILDAARRGIAEAEQNLARFRSIEAMVMGNASKAPQIKEEPAVAPKAMTIGEAATRVLREAGRPLGTAEITKRIIAAKLYQSSVGLRDFSNNVFSTLKCLGSA